jgi:Zn-dependent protease with chaperone function
VTVPPPVIHRAAEGNDEVTAVKANRRRAIKCCVLPGLGLGAIVGLVLLLIGQPVVGAAALVLLTVGISVWLWRMAPGAVLRAVGAVPSVEWDHPRMHNLVDGLCATMGLPRPEIWVVDSPIPNAMALGRDPRTSVLVVTSGLDQALTLVELEGVLAHELVHIKRHDTVLAGVAVVVTVPWAMVRGQSKGLSTVHQLIGRGREFSADQRAAEVVRYPAGVGSALDAMVDQPPSAVVWPPGTGRIAFLTRWLWIDPLVGGAHGETMEGNLDDTRVRAAALSLR